MVRAIAVFVVMLAGCGGTSIDAPVPSTAMCADVVDVTMTREPAGTYRFDVTVRSADTGWEKYADGWEVRSPDGTVLGTRVLAHPHVDEQPFTRTLTGVAIPAGITEVVVAARDLVDGFCGETMTLPVG